jgi:cell volume regulation protein A
VLATFPLLAGLPQSPLIFDLVFFIVVVSVLHGTTVLPVAKWLGMVTSAEMPVRQNTTETLEADSAA